MDGKETQTQQALSRLRTKLLVMCATVGIALDEISAALASGAPNTALGKAAAIAENDRVIDGLEVEIDELALTFLARHQPVAQDLRFAVGGLRMVVDLERIGDEAAAVAERLLSLQGKVDPKTLHYLLPLMQAARVDYAWAIEAFKSGEGGTPPALRERERASRERELEVIGRIIAQLQSGIREGLTQKEGPAAEEPGAAVHAILIGKAFSRISQHAINLAEQACFIHQGVNVKHQFAKEESAVRRSPEEPARVPRPGPSSSA